MEHSISALTYKGSIPEAILEAKRQKKLFVVYISGGDSASTQLENSTWTDAKVAEAVPKYCILLHFVGGSTDGVNFTAIYPQKSVPCIAAIGYNGVQLWQSEGFVNAEDLVSSLEKAWLSLHIQETTATVLTAALASRKPEPSTSVSSDVGSSRQGSAGSAEFQSPSADEHVESFSAAEMMEVKVNQDRAIEDQGSKLDDKTSLQLPGESQNVGDNQLKSSAEEAKGLPTSLMVEPQNSTADHIPSGAEDSCSAQETVIDHHLGVPQEDSPFVTPRTSEAIRDECMDAGKADILENSARAKVPHDVHLNIRLPDGVSLQEKFPVMSTLRMVKDYVDRNQSGIGTYDLAIPYPRKVFSDQDLSKSLSELGLSNRQALIVLPHRRASRYYIGVSASRDKATAATGTDSSNANDSGYFAYLRRFLSYMNPLSYLGRNVSSSTSGQPQNSMWEYGPNPALHNSNARPESSNYRYAPSQRSLTTDTSDGKNKKPTTSRFGSNIHTLKHDEDDGRFSDRNSFWNGNSTQYGGNGDEK